MNWREETNRDLFELQAACLAAALYQRSEDGTALTPQGMKQITDATTAYRDAVARAVAEAIGCAWEWTDNAKPCSPTEVNPCPGCTMLTELGAQE